jgi:hypothetical protein
VNGPPAPVRHARSGRRGLIIAGVIVGGLGVLAICAVLFVKALFGLVGGMAQRPWARLHEASVAVQTDDGARAFYDRNPGLAGRFTTADDFLTRARAWRPLLAGFPPEAPDMMTMIKTGGSISVNTTNSRTELSLKGYRGFSALLVLDGNRLVDLWVE